METEGGFGLRRLQHTFPLWNKRKEKGTTLQRRLNRFFAMIVVSVILLFTLLLMLFGFTGTGRQVMYNYLENELRHVSNSIETDFGNLSMAGIALAETLSASMDLYFEEHELSAGDLSNHPEHIQSLLADQMTALRSVAGHNACGGVFLVLEPTKGSKRLPGIFLKKTQPISSASLMSTMYFLRGPASIAIDHGIELLGQWHMEYEAEEVPFFRRVIETAEANPDLPLSKLYYWSSRICLNDNSETGMLVCLPLRSSDGTVYGVCGIEVSDRMFKLLYSPEETNYHGAFTMAAPSDGRNLDAPNALIAGNSYLTRSQMTSPFSHTGSDHGFSYYDDGNNRYGGLSQEFHLYRSGSPYADEVWKLAVLVPEDLLVDAIKGNSLYFALLVAGLLIISLIGCTHLSGRYLRPIQQGLSSIQEKAYETDTATADFGVVEIDSLFEDLSRSVREHREELEQLVREKQNVEEQYEKAQTQIDRLSDRRKQEIDPDEYAIFLENVDNLTVTERKIFDMYLDGRTPKEILEILTIKENTLKYHNRNIYGKLGVKSRKQLLTYAAVMERRESDSRTAPQ